MLAVMKCVSYRRLYGAAEWVSTAAVCNCFALGAILLSGERQSDHRCRFDVAERRCYGVECGVVEV